jgi:hypothetical protein
MENGHFRHVSVGALILAAGVLLAAVVSAASVIVSEPKHRTAKLDTAQKTRIQGELRSQGKMLAPEQVTVIQASTNGVEISKWAVQN